MKYVNRSIKKYLLLLLVTSILLIIYIKVEPINFVVNIIAISFIVSYAIKPFRDFISERTKVSPKISALIIIIIGISIILLIGYFILPILVEEGQNFSEIIVNLEEYILQLLENVNLRNVDLVDKIYIETTNRAKTFTEDISTNIINNGETILENLIGVGIIPVITYYFLADGELIYNRFLLIFPTNKRVIIRKVNKNIDKVLSRYIISQLLLCIIIGTMTFIMLIIIGVRFALVLSLINGIVNIIPYFGPIIGSVPIILIALIDSPSKVLFVLIGSFLIQQIEGDLLAPKITGDSTKLHPVIIIILLVLGERIGGALGMILAVPIVVIIKVIYEDINYYLF